MHDGENFSPSSYLLFSAIGLTMPWYIWFSLRCLTSIQTLAAEATMCEIYVAQVNNWPPFAKKIEQKHRHGKPFSRIPWTNRSRFCSNVYAHRKTWAEHNTLTPSAAMEAVDTVRPLLNLCSASNRNTVKFTILSCYIATVTYNMMVGIIRGYSTNGHETLSTDARQQLSIVDNMQFINIKVASMINIACSDIDRDVQHAHCMKRSCERWMVALDKGVTGTETTLVIRMRPHQFLGSLVRLQRHLFFVGL